MIKTFICLSVFIVLSITEVRADVLLEDNFDGFNSEIWQEMPRGAAIDNGTLTEKGKGGVTLISRKAFKYKTFEAKVRFNNLNVPYYIGFVKEIPWNESACWAQISGNTLDCRLGNRGMGDSIGRFTLEADKWYTFKIIWSEEKITFFIDDKQIGMTDSQKIIPNSSLKIVIATLTVGPEEIADIEVDWVKVTGKEEEGESVSASVSRKSAHKKSDITLPQEWEVLKDIPNLIEQYNLEERDPQSNEKWGTKVGPEDEERGYIVFKRHYMDTIFCYSVPNNKIDSLSIFTSLGEYEPVSFSIYPLKDISGLKVSVTDIVNEKGAIIKKDNIDIRLIRAIPFIKDEETYALEPLLLEKFSKIDLSGKKVIQLWLTLYIPENVQPGNYTGKIELESDKTKPYQIQLSCKVLPIKLQEPDILYGMCFLIPGRKDLYPENLDKYFADMKAHGMNSMWTWPDCTVKKEGDKITYDFSKFGFTRQDLNYFGHSLEEIMNGYLKTGFTKPWVCGSLDTLGGVIEKGLGYTPRTPEFDKAYIEYVKQLLKKAKEKGWPSFSLHPIDEAGPRPDAMEFAKYYYKLLKENFPDVKTFADVGPWKGEDEILSPYVDIMCYACQFAKEIERCKKAGDEFWIYNQGGWGRFNKVDRFTRGLYTWKTGAKGVFDWVYTWWIEPKVPPSWHPSFIYVIPSPDGPVPTIGWENIREGIDDAKYIYTLSQSIHKAKLSGNPELIKESENAENELNKILNDVPTEFHSRTSYVEKISSETFDSYRLEIANQIIKLEKLLSNKQ
jgi:hypothetical protein